MLHKFDAMPLKHKIAIVHKEYDGISCRAYIRGYEQEGEVGNIIEYSGFSGRRRYDDIDWLTFLNDK